MDFQLVESVLFSIRGMNKTIVVIKRPKYIKKDLLKILVHEKITEEAHILCETRLMQMRRHPQV